MSRSSWIDRRTAGPGGTALFPLQDELGNVERLTSATGATAERYEYEGYGKFRMFDANNSERSASAFGWRWLFQGREYNSLLSAYDFRARTLWPELGRFGQEDPMETLDSMNLYQAFLVAPNRNVDPFGSIINDSVVMSSNRASSYSAVKTSFLMSPLGTYAWNRFAASAVFTLDFTANNTRDLSAETKRHLDAASNYTSAEISVGPQFGRIPDPEPWYSRGRAIYSSDRDHNARNVYTMGHELGHVMYGLDPTTAVDAHKIDVLNAQIDAIAPQYTGLLRVPARQLTQQQRQQLAQLSQQLSTLNSSMPANAKANSESYADATGEIFYYSYRAAHPARRIQVPNPTPALPPRSLP